MRPVGEPVPLRRKSLPAGGESWPAGFCAYFVQSGTAALGAGLRYIRERQGRVSGTVIIPAYGCPDLVSAARYAALDPVLCDLAPGSPFLDRADLERKLDADVVAVVGTHFLGLREDMGGLVTACKASGVPVIEDSAQRLPDPESNTDADAIIYSFGRGKPVSGMGGGALLLRNPVSSPPEIGGQGGALTEAIIPSLMPFVISARNLCLTDLGYGFLKSIPGTGLGKVRFKPLCEVRSLDRWRLELARDLLPIRTGEAEETRRRGDCIAAILKKFSGQILDLPASLGQQSSATLLRYPVLLPDRASRDRVLACLEKDGLGASAFYGRTLADLPGVPQVSGEAPEARRFADRLLTLPVHSGVSDRYMGKIETALATVLA